MHAYNHGLRSHVQGVALPAVHSMIPTYVNPRTQSLVAGVVTSACYIGALLAFQIVPSLIAAAGMRTPKDKFT
jgi:hypothetical protein